MEAVQCQLNVLLPSIPKQVSERRNILHRRFISLRPQICFHHLFSDFVRPPVGCWHPSFGDYYRRRMAQSNPEMVQLLHNFLKRIWMTNWTTQVDAWRASLLVGPRDGRDPQSGFASTQNCGDSPIQFHLRNWSGNAFGTFDGHVGSLVCHYSRHRRARCWPFQHEVTLATHSIIMLSFEWRNYYGNFEFWM